MILANSAQIAWDGKKKNWIVSIQIGEEVIRRPSDEAAPRGATDDLLRAAAVRIAKDDGYEVRADAVRVVR
jgi:hypothetical protein